MHFLLILMFLTSCGYDPEVYQEQPPEIKEPVKEQPKKPITKKTPAKKTKGVEISVKVTTTLGEDELDWPELLRVGLTLEQVEYILGPPDDSYLTASGLMWHYDNYDGVCAANRKGCSVYFDRNKEVFSSIGINPELKDYTSL